MTGNLRYSGLTQIIRVASALGLAVGAAGCDGDGGSNREPSAAIVQADGLLSRQILFGGPDRIRGRLSPDGSKSSWIGRVGDSARLFVGPAEDPEAARAVSPEDARAVIYDWARNNTHAIVGFLTASGGVSLESIDVATGRRVALSPADAGMTWVAATSWDHPDEVVLMVGDLAAPPSRYLRANVVTGETRTVLENAEGFDTVVFDSDLEPRVARLTNPAGGVDLLRRRPGGDWEPIAEVAAADADGFQVVGLDASGEGLILIDGRDRASSALVRLDLASAERSTLGAVEGADVVDVLTHPVTGEPDAFAVNRVRKEWIPLNVRAAEAFHALEKATEGELSVLARTVDDRFWIAFDETASSPGRYFVFDRDSGDIAPMLDIQPALATAAPIVTTPIVIKARDGLDLVSHLTLPSGADIDGDGAPDRASPLLIILPQGPASRAPSGFDANARWAADRGYAVLRVNVRGSGGFGEAHLAAGDGEWGGAVQNDVEDVADWAIEHGVADAGRIGVIGGGFGGATAIEAAARDPERFACAAAWAAPVDFVAIVEDPPAYWRRAALSRHVGDPADPVARSKLEAHSLIRRDSLARPILALYPEADKNAQAERARAWIETLDAGESQATYVGFDVGDTKIENPSLAVGAAALFEAFFAGCLGGALEPIEGDLAVSAITRVIGEGHIEGLTEALAAVRLAAAD